MEKGGNVLVLLGEGGETRFGTNINFLLEDFGIMVNNGKQLEVYFCLKIFAVNLVSVIRTTFSLFPDAVVRTSYYRYFHPKEVYVSNGVLNRYKVETLIKTQLYVESI